MTDTNQKQLGTTLWKIADDPRGSMSADDFHDYMLSFLFLRYLSDNYETAAKKELGKDYPEFPDNVLREGGAEERIRTKLLKDGHIDTVIGLPANLFYSTGIPVCILVLKKCKKPDDVLFINAAEHFVKGKRQNQLTEEHISKIIATYQLRTEEPRYSRRVEMEDIEKNAFNLNISRYISTAVGEEEIDLSETNERLLEIEEKIRNAANKHNEFLKELSLPEVP
jgi:type I restriction enzyme M protein